MSSGCSVLTAVRISNLRVETERCKLSGERDNIGNNNVITKQTVETIKVR
jgi:hypothetical protein